MNQSTHLNQDLPICKPNITQRIAILEKLVDQLLTENVRINKVLAITPIPKIPEQEEPFSFDRVAFSIAIEYGFTVTDLKGKSRLRNLVDARQMCMFIIYENNKRMSKTAIGRCFDRDHSTVIHSISAVEDRFFGEPRQRQFYNELVEKIRNNFALKSGK